MGNAGGAAQPAPRNADGSFPNESCTIHDPTSEGCIKPRLYHALTEARLAGFTRYTHCWRQQSWASIHWARPATSRPRGGFGGATEATGRGTEPAGGVVHRELGRSRRDVRDLVPPDLDARIGWRSYDGCCDAAATDENHVHLSVL